MSGWILAAGAALAGGLNAHRRDEELLKAANDAVGMVRKHRLMLHDYALQMDDLLLESQQARDSSAGRAQTIISGLESEKHELQQRLATLEEYEVKKKRPTRGKIAVKAPGDVQAGSDGRA